MNAGLIALMGLLLAGCQHPKSQSVECGLEIAHLDSVLSKPGGTVIFGEFHGTVEVPRFVGAVACQAAKRGPTVVGLEMPADPTFDAYLRSDGGEAAKKALLAGSFWTDPFQDGRRSVGNLELIEQIRRCQKAGFPIELFFFDGQKTADKSRDQVMAENVLAKRKQRPEATFLLLTGNLHANKQSGFASRLSSSISLDVRHQPGTAWVCRRSSPDSCGPAITPPSEAPADRAGIDLTRAPDGSFDGFYDVVSFTASPPAAFPEKAVDLPERVRQLMSSMPE